VSDAADEAADPISDAPLSKGRPKSGPKKGRAAAPDGSAAEEKID